MSDDPDIKADWEDIDVTPGASSGRTRTVLVPLDGTLPSLSSLPVARVFAEILGAALNIVHVGERILPPHDIVEKLGLTPEETLGSVINQATGTPADAIVRLAIERRSSLIAMCTHTGLKKPRGKLGSVSEGVLYRSKRPVVLVHPERGHRPWTLQHILFPHEGTPTTAAALGLATSLADRASAELVILHVAAAGSARPVEPGTFAAPRYLDQPQHEWPAWAKEFLMRVHAMGIAAKEVRTRLLVAAGELAPEIVRSASENGSNLILLAWRGHLEAKRAATIKAVIREAPCPVLIVCVGRQERDLSAGSYGQDLQ